MTASPLPAPRVELLSVTRRYGSCVSVDDATLTFEPGVIHAVVGENGAGKSTLLKMAAGVIEPSSGEVRIGGEPLRSGGTAVAIRRGVGLVHQHFMLVGAFTGLENLVLGHEPTRSGGRLDLAAAADEARAIMKSTGLTVPLDAVTSTLTVGERQRLEILRVLYRGARAILLDEPTAVLSPLEADELYATLRRLADGGATLVVVTHRLDEVVRHASVVSVMRRGRLVDAPRGAAPRASVEALTAAIMGGAPPSEFSPSPLRDDAPVVLAVKGLRLERAGEGGRGRAVLQGVDLAVRAGEIVGVAGVEGNGQRELVRALAGLEPSATGSVRVGERDLARLDVKARRRWLGVVHEDRHEDGLLLSCAVADNFVLGELDRLRAMGGAGTEAAFVARRMKEAGVVPPDATLAAASLSGGNQQKIVVGRVLDRWSDAGAGRTEARAVVLAQPTRGVDVGAAAAIHRAIGEAATSGVATLVLSADLAELRRLSHRLVVIREGRVVAELSREASEAEIGRAMLGVEGGESVEETPRA